MRRSSAVIVAVVALSVLFPVNAGAMQGAGGSAAAWWIVGGVLFAFPSTAVILHLAATDGSPFRSLVAGGHLAHAGARGIWVAGTVATMSASAAAVSFLARALGVDPPATLQGILAIALALAGIFMARSRAWARVLLVGAVALALVLVVGLIALVIAARSEAVAASAGAGGDWTDVSLAGWSWLGLVILGLVGAHVPFQRSDLRPVSTRPVVIAMVVAVVGYLILTLACALALPTGTATTATGLVDLAGTVSPGLATPMALLLFVSFAATTIAFGGAFRELAGDLRLPAPSSAVVIVAVGVACYVVLPLAFGASVGSAPAVVTYAITQGAAAVLWAFGYVALGVLVLRSSATAWLKVAAALTAVLGALGVLGALVGSQTSLISNDAISFSVGGAPVTLGAWALIVLVVSAVALVVTWLVKAEGDHLAEQHSVESS